MPHTLTLTVTGEAQLARIAVAATAGLDEIADSFGDMLHLEPEHVVVAASASVITAFANGWPGSVATLAASTETLRTFVRRAASLLACAEAERFTKFFGHHHPDTMWVLSELDREPDYREDGSCLVRRDVVMQYTEAPSYPRTPVTFSFAGEVQLARLHGGFDAARDLFGDRMLCGLNTQLVNATTAELDAFEAEHGEGSVERLTSFDDLGMATVALRDLAQRAATAIVEQQVARLDGQILAEVHRGPFYFFGTCRMEREVTVLQ